MNTFTTYAEKKAKQFFNLLQGYTKGIRITAILILLLMGVSNAWAANGTISGGGIIYLNSGGSGLWDQGSAWFSVYFMDANKSTTKFVSMTKVTGNYYYAPVPTGTWKYVIFVRNNPTDKTADWTNVWNQTADLETQSDKNLYTITGWSYGSWSTYQPTSNVSLTASSASVNTNTNVTLTPSLTSNTTYNDIKSTSYSISPSSGASINGNTFTATAAGTYTITATITYNAKGFTNITSTATATTTITVKAKTTNSLTVVAGEGIASVTGSKDPVELNSSYPITATLKTGYTFSTWTADPSANATFENATSANTNVTVKNGAVTVTASATENTHDVTVSYKYGSTTIKDNTTTTAVGEANAKSITAPSITGYTFKEWTLGDGITNKSANTTSSTISITTKESGNYILTANYDIIPCNFLYGSSKPLNNPTDGGKMSYDPNEEAYYIDVTTNSSPYHFRFKYNSSKQYSCDWSTYPAGKEIKADGVKVDCDKDVTNWGDKSALEFKGANGSAIRIWFDYTNKEAWITTKTYTVTVQSSDINMGTVTPTTSTEMSETIGGSITATANSGYHFTEWSIVSGSGSFTNANAASTTFKPTQESIVQAIFLANKYTVRFHANDGEGDMEDQEFTYDVEQALTANNFTRTGYTFAGWNTNANGSGTAYNDGQSVQKLTDDDNGTINLYAQWTEIKYTINISTDGNGTVEPDGDQQIGIKGLEVTATPKDPSRFRFTKWEVSGGAIVADDYGATTTVTATEDGSVIAHFEELQPKTIYLKTVEGTADGYKWYIRYNGTEVMMTELGCTGEYYRGEVPEETEFQLIAKDNGDNIIAKETRDGLVVPDDNKNMLNLVSLAAGGNKIFFKPNSHWKNHSTHKYFVARFYTGSVVIKDLIDNDGDGIYECEKPAGTTEVYFCLTKEKASDNSWNDWPSDKEAQTADGVKTIPDGKNLFTLGDDQTVGGENDSGTWSEFADTPVNGEGEWTIFEGATYRITFNHEGATSGTTTPGVAHVDVQLNSSMPVIELESLPKNTAWKFGGYYTAADGGTPITNAFGDWLDADGYISNGKWVKEECVTLYAHWVEKTPEITNVALGKDVFDVGSTETTTATPTVVQHSYSGAYVICWKLLDNSGTIMEFFPFTPGDNNSVSFSVDGLTAGTYTVRASIYDTDCDTGEELSRYDAKFTIVSGYKVTVKYLCGDDVIKASDIFPGHATTPTPITAPEIGGYKFVNWELGDGIFSESDLNSQTISYTAIYDGYLTAKYEKRKLIFLDISTLPNKEKWTAPHIYLYKGAKDDKNGGYWNDQTGAGGATGGNYIKHAAMTKVPDTENIWYFDYEQYTNNFNVFVAFTSNNQGNVTHFANCEVIYRADFTSGTPVFVPASDQTAETKNATAKYYSKGYWVRYMGGTGYWLIIYNADGNKELVRREFTSETQRMTMTSIVDLEAKHTYKYEIYRNDGYYYRGGDITYTNSSNYKPLNEANKHSIKTTETGNYTFTLDYFTGDLQIKVQYPGEVGDYRILYKDNTRTTYKPSDIKKAEELNPVTSFFIRPNSNPELKIQTATYISDSDVSWSTTNEDEIHFKPNANWESDGARFAAYFYKGNTTKVWKDLTKNGDIYTCEKPSGCTHVIFCRMDPEVKTNSFDKGDGKPLWNQTRDLTLPTDKKNFYTLEEGAWRGQIYLKPNSNWTTDGARFAAYFFEKSGNNTTKEEWHSMFKEDDGTYWCDIPEGCSQVIFCRMNPNVQDNNWNTGDGQPFWGMQTNDLQIPTNSNDLYTITNGQNKPTGAWSCKSWNEINTGSFTDLTEELKEKLGEINGDIGKAPDSVYTIHLEQNNGTFSVAKVVPYSGNFYIRVDALDGKWYDYKTNPDNLMTYSAFSESDANSFGEKFSHYKTKWCTQGTNVKFVIANDYSLCISDTLVQDAGNPFGNIDTHGNINNDDKYNANIRFMWNRHTNKVSRAYVAAASDEGRKFLVLKANKTIQNESGHAINNNEVVFQDTQNWLYERTIKVQPGTLVKLYACYPDLDEAKAQHFRGKYSNDFTENETAVKILGGNSEEWYTMRIVYDFKTNRLMGAWVPDQNIDGQFEIDADVMVIRQHQEDATCITFADDESTLTAVKTVYGVIRFNRWTLNNRSTSDHKVLPVQSQKSIYERALYFISFPFDVHLSDVFGFGTYGTHWVISEYNGLRRAQRGYFAEDCINEDCTNWDYIWDPSNFTLKANQGYLLSLDLDLMKSDNTSFWAHDIQQVELFFPSYANVQTIKQTSYTMPALGEEYLCKINHNTDGTKPDRDRRVKDSYWRCIGVPSFADYNTTLTTDGTTAITWQPQNGDIPFLYEWNVSDNSLMVRAASKYKFRPTYAYLVQNGQEIHWSAVNTKPSTPIIARQRTEADRNYEWKIALMRDGNQEDQTFLRVTDNENVTTEFDFNQDLAKEFNYGRGDIYTLIGYERVAANSMPCSDKTTIIPLGLNIEQAGDYTIAMPEGVENIGITLVDNETGIHTNLSAGQEYTLTLNNGICENRLFIEVSPIKNTPTDLEYTTEDTREQTTRKVLINEKLYIIRDGVVYDAQGHRL